MATKAARIQEARRYYNEAKKLRNKLGKKARGKPKSSTVYKDYKLINREYHKAGEHLGRLTGRKSRRA